MRERFKFLGLALSLVLCLAASALGQETTGNIRGTVKGEWVEGDARIIEPESSEHVFSLLKKKYGMMYRMIRSAERFSRSKAKPVSLAIKIGS